MDPVKPTGTPYNDANLINSTWTLCNCPCPDLVKSTGAPMEPQNARQTWATQPSGRNMGPHTQTHPRGDPSKGFGKSGIFENFQPTHANLKAATQGTQSSDPQPLPLVKGSMSGRS